MPESPSERQARELYRQQRQITLASVRAVDNVLSDTDDVDRIAAVIAAYQLASATAAASSYDNAAGQTLGIIADAFAGFNAVGLPLQIPLETIFDDAGRFTSGTGLKTNPRHRVVRFAASQVQDAGRGVGQAAIVSHPEWTNYVRVLNPPSCSRCAILAGRIYRDLAHFQRHPLCDCQMWPVASWEKAHDAGLVVSARTAFRDGQIRGLSEADTRAIEDGADINQVVNAAQGMTRVEMFGRKANATLAGTTTRSQWRKDHPNLKVRLRPETIYAEANGNRDEALRLLRVHGFIRDDATSSGSSSGSGSSGGSRGSGTGDSGPNDRVLPFDDDHPFTGKLGTAGAANPPTVELLQRLAVVAPVSDRRRYLDDRAG
ncbi:MAG: hypothetical protein JWO46_1715, partial [Nocardioidaceae bacterium]|nr:hypothetical protein [Nocardioidaceae bacterium]